jgi:hypothetical protein
MNATAETTINATVTTTIGTKTAMENDHHSWNESRIKKNALAVDHTQSTALFPKHEATTEPGLK